MRSDAVAAAIVLCCSAWQQAAKKHTNNQGICLYGTITQAMFFRVFPSGDMGIVHRFLPRNGNGTGRRDPFGYWNGTTVLNGLGGRGMNRVGSATGGELGRVHSQEIGRSTVGKLVGKMIGKSVGVSVGESIRNIVKKTFGRRSPEWLGTRSRKRAGTTVEQNDAKCYLSIAQTNLRRLFSFVKNKKKIHVVKCFRRLFASNKFRALIYRLEP